MDHSLLCTSEVGPVCDEIDVCVEIAQSVAFLVLSRPCGFYIIAEDSPRNLAQRRLRGLELSGTITWPDSASRANQRIK